MRRVLTGLFLLGMCGLQSSCYLSDQGVMVIAVDGSCQLVGKNGAPLGEINIKDDDLIAWTNNTNHLVKFVVTDPHTFGGRHSLRLQPGEVAVIRVAGNRAKSMISWTCVKSDGEAGTESGGSGGNDPVNNSGGSGGH